MTASHVQMVCARCGSTDVKGDAYAVWDHLSQMWDVSGGEIFDKGSVCENCDSACRIEERPLTKEELAQHAAFGAEVMTNDDLIAVLRGCASENKRLRELGERLCGVIEEIHDAHIYGPDDRHPADCRYCAVVKICRLALAEPVDISDIPEQGPDFFAGARLTTPKGGAA